MARIEKRTLKDGSTRYKAIIRRKGAPMRTRTFRTRAQAVTWARRIDNRIDDKKAVPSAADRRRTFSDLVEKYTAEVAPEYQSKDAQRRVNQLRWWEGRLGELKLVDIRRPDISDSLDALAQGSTPSGRPASPATRNRYLAAVRHAFAQACNRWEWMSSNPASGMLATEPRGRVRYLSDSERVRLLKACSQSDEPHLNPIVIVALSTGARQGEIIGLRWSDVDLARSRALLHDTKNGESRAIPVVGAAKEALTEHSRVRRIDSDFLFPNQKGNPTFPQDAWNKALRAAKIDDFRFHDLRHSAASYLAMNGATLAEIAEVLGHRTLAMVKRYSHLTEQHTAAVVTRMNEAIFGPSS